MGDTQHAEPTESVITGCYFKQRNGDVLLHQSKTDPGAFVVTIQRYAIVPIEDYLTLGGGFHGAGAPIGPAKFE
jgi:hypothetical protein